MNRVSIVLLVLLASAFSQISFPMTKRTLNNEEKNYELNHFYTLDLVIMQGKNTQSLKAVIDLQSIKTWVVDSKCTNCFDKLEESGFNCDQEINSCGESFSDSPHLILFGSKIRVTKHKPLNALGKLGSKNFKLHNAVDILTLKEYSSDADRQYLETVNSGIGFGQQVLLNPQNPLYQLFHDANISPKIFSLFFNKYFGRVFIGKSEIQFGENGETLKIVEGETWSVLVGPYMRIDSASPQISAHVDEHPSEQYTDGLLIARLDSTTKFIRAPLVVWERLNKILFQYNNCLDDTHFNMICDCSGSWKPLTLDLIRDPKVKDIQNNFMSVSINPEQYLEDTEKSGKCLLLLKPRESDASIEYIFGTSFLSNFHTIFNLDLKTVKFTHSFGFVPMRKHIDDTSLLLFTIIGSIFALILIGLLFRILKKVNVTNEDLKNILKKTEMEKILVPEQSISFLVSSPRQTSSLAMVPGGATYFNRVISSPKPQNSTVQLNNSFINYQ